MSWLTPYLDEKIFLGRDGSQMEIRMLCQLSGDKLLTKQLNSGEDIHPQVAHSVFGWSMDRVKKEKKARVIAKQLHFGIIFGLRDPAIYKTCLRYGVDTTLEEVSQARENYFRKYYGVREYIEYCIEYVEKHGRTVPNLFGMSRDLDTTGQTGNGAFWKNQAINTPVQGSAAQYLILALAIVKTKRDKYSLISNDMRNEVHDALYTTPKLRDLVEADKLLQELLEKDTVEELKRRFKVKLNIPILSEAAVGFRFGTMIDYESKDAHLRQEPLEKVVSLWCKKNLKIEKGLKENPLKFIDLQRGVAA